MTLASGLLLVLEPRPVSAMKGLSLSSVDRLTPQRGESLLFDPIQAAQAGRWSAVVIHYGLPASQTDHAGSDGLQAQESYHFTVSTGSRSSQEQIQIGSRWYRQQAGTYWTGPESQWVNRHAIGVLLDNAQPSSGLNQQQLARLVWLVQRLQARFLIPADRVILQLHADSPTDQGWWFPEAWFRQQLLTFVGP